MTEWRLDSRHTHTRSAGGNKRSIFHLVPISFSLFATRGENVGFFFPIPPPSPLLCVSLLLCCFIFLLGTKSPWLCVSITLSIPLRWFRRALFAVPSRLFVLLTAPSPEESEGDGALYTELDLKRPHTHTKAGRPARQTIGRAHEQVISCHYLIIKPLHTHTQADSFSRSVWN